MGTDIHPFVEYDRSEVGEPFGESADVVCLNRGEYFLPNLDELLDALGNGRSRHFPAEHVKRWALFPPRGLPANLSHSVVIRYSHPIAEAGSRYYGGYWDTGVGLGLPPVTPSKAVQWVVEGWSQYYTPPATPGATTLPTRRVSHCDWRLPSWLLLTEIKQALAHFSLDVAKLPPEVETLLETMSTLEKRIGEGRTRLVFWFDN